MMKNTINLNKNHFNSSMYAFGKIDFSQNRKVYVFFSSHIPLSRIHRENDKMNVPEFLVLLG